MLFGLCLALWMATVAGTLLLPAGAAIAQSLTLDIGEDSGSTTPVFIMLECRRHASVAGTGYPDHGDVVRADCCCAVPAPDRAFAHQQSPPNIVLISLALFMTAFIMAPTFEQALENGVQPLIEEDIFEAEAF